MITKIKKYKWKFTFLLFIVLCVVGFLSNQTLKIFFSEKVWAHKVNNQERLIKATSSFSGVELDIVFYQDSNYFDVNHPPEKSIGLSLATYLNNVSINNIESYWLDFKNLDSGNAKSSLFTLDSLVKENHLIKKQIIVESPRLALLHLFSQKGFKTAYYIPTELHSMTSDELASQIKHIQNQLKLNSNTYLSFEYKDYPIIKKEFPEQKKICWFTVYGSMNKFKARCLLYEILMDKKVDVLLLPL